MATPTAICPVCFVRFPVAETTSTPTACPACAHKFAAPVRDDDEPVAADIVDDSDEDEFRKESREARPGRAKRVTPAKPARTGFRRRGGEAATADEDRSPTLTPLVALGLIFGAASLLCVVIVLLVVSLSSPDRSGEVAEWTPEPVKPFAPQPNPDPVPPNPNPNPEPVRPNPDPVRPPIGLPVGPFPEDPFNPGPVFPNVPPVKPLPPERPKQKMKLPAVTPVAMTAAPLTEDSTEVKLPGAVTDACVGGGGRYYCLLLGDKKQIAVFDVCAVKVVKYLPVAGDGAKIAANMNKLLVVYPDDNLVTRYDLTTFEKEATVKLPFDGKVKAVAMGSASAGPLLVHYIAAFARGAVAFLDPIKFTEYAMLFPAAGAVGPFPANTAHFRASPDGTVYGRWATGTTPTGLGSVVLVDDVVKSHYVHDSVGHVVPGPDGTLHTVLGQYTPGLKAKGVNDRGFSLPAAGGNLYFTLATEGEGNGPGRFPGRDAVKQKADIKMEGDARSLVTLKDLPGAPSDAWAGHDFTADKRYLLVPDAKAFVALATTNDKLIVRKFDVIASMEASGVDYLFVTSRPGGVKPGERFDYQIETKSKKGGVTYTLDAGPDGLTVSPTGRVTWAVPKGYAGGETAIITVADKSGQQVFHTFALKEWAEVAAVGSKPPVPVEPPPVAVDPPKLPKPPVVVPWPGANADPNQVVMAPAKPFAIPRTKITEKTAVALPDSADAMCLGGGGRFVLYRLPKSKQLAVVDLCEGKVVKYLPLAEANATFAAGMSKVYVYNPTADVFQRWSLETFEKEATIKNPVGGSPKTLLMGHATDGPLTIVGSTERVPGGGSAFTFLNPITFKVVEVKAEEGRFGRLGADGGAVVRVSGDGRVYGWHRTSGSPQGFDSLVLSGKTAKRYSQHNTPWHVGVGADGTLFAGFGIFTPEQKPIGGKFVDTYPNPVNVPAAAAPWYLRVTYADRFGGAKGKEKNEVALALVGELQLTLPLADHEGFQFPAETPHPAHIGRGTPFHDLDRFVLNPQAGVLAIISGTGDKVYLHPLDLKALLAKTDKNYLMVMSQPPAAAKGQKWTYTPDVWSKTNKAVVKVETGPPGMTATGGTVTWTVPKDFADAEAQVILTVTDGGKQETFHTFALPVGGAK